MPYHRAKQEPDAWKPGPRATQHLRLLRTLGGSLVLGLLQDRGRIISETEIARRYDVSRRVVRDVLLALLSKNVISRASPGFRVRQRQEWHLFDPEVIGWYDEAGQSSELLAHASEFCFAIEQEAASLSARRRSDREAAELLRCVEEMSECTSEANLARSCAKFQTIVFEASCNPLIMSTLPLAGLSLSKAIAANFSSHPDFQESVVRRYAHVAEAIGAGSAADARSAMRSVLDTQATR